MMNKTNRLINKSLLLGRVEQWSCWIRSGLFAFMGWAFMAGALTGSALLVTQAHAQTQLKEKAQKKARIVGTDTQPQQPILRQSGAKAELQSRLQSLSSYVADFKQQVFDMSGELLQDAGGKIHLQQPQKLHWELLPPNEGILIADGETLWHIDPFVEQVVALNQLKAVNNHPIMLIAQPKSTMWADYQVVQNDERFIVSPKQGAGNIQQLIITFNQRMQLAAIELLDQQEQRNVLTFSNIQLNPDIRADLFQFNLPEGFDLDDQR